MKKPAYLLALFTPLIYVSPWFQNLLLPFRAYLPAVAMIVLLRKNPKWGFAIGIFSALIMDALVAPGIGAYGIFHALMIVCYYVAIRWIPKPSATTLAIMTLVLGYGLEILVFIVLITLGWPIHRLTFDLFLLLPFATAWVMWIVASEVLNPMDDYTIFRRDRDE